jgi:hypothetical protein
MDQVAYRALIVRLDSYKATLHNIVGSGSINSADFADRTPRLLHALRVWKVEFSIALKEWMMVLDVVQELMQLSRQASKALALETCEAVADMLVCDQSSGMYLSC